MKDSKYIDHTLLKATATREQIANLCAEANKYDFNECLCNHIGYLLLMNY